MWKEKLYKRLWVEISKVCFQHESIFPNKMLQSINAIKVVYGKNTLEINVSFYTARKIRFSTILRKDATCKVYLIFHHDLSYYNI